MDKELGMSQFDSFIELKQFIKRMDGVILEIINIECDSLSNYTVYYWATNTEHR